MLEQPRLIKILRNDSWSATTLGSLIFMAVVSILAQLVDKIAGAEFSQIKQYILMTAVLFVFTLLVVPYRIWYVRKIFENGIEIKAIVIGRKTHKANLKLTLKYDLHGVPCEKVFDQVITEQTKHLAERAEVDLIIDQDNPLHILLKDAYA